MSDIIDYQQKAELIKTARRQLYSDYLSCQKSGYNTWVTEVDVARRASKSLPGSPLLKPFPTETDVISKALELYNVINFAAAPAPAATPAPAVATYLDKIHEVYTTPIVLLDTAPKEEGVQATGAAPAREPESPSIGAQLAAAYYGDPLDTASAPSGEISIADQLSAVYSSKFVEPTMPLVPETLDNAESDPTPGPELDSDSDDADTKKNSADLVVDVVAAVVPETEPIVEAAPTIVPESESIVETGSVGIVEPTSKVTVAPDGVVLVASKKSVSGFQQLIAKLLKTDQQGTKNV